MTQTWSATKTHTHIDIYIFTTLCTTSCQYVCVCVDKTHVLQDVTARYSVLHGDNNCLSDLEVLSPTQQNYLTGCNC